MKKQFLLLSLLIIITTFFIACDDENLQYAPKGNLDLKAAWSPNAPADRSATAAFFNHEKHDDFSCLASCHGTERGGKFTPAGAINGISPATNSAHKFCVDCHNIENAKGDDREPVIIQSDCNRCHLNGATFNGGNTNLGSWIPTAKQRTDVTFSHDNHKNQQCTPCHDITPTTVENGKIGRVKNSKEAAHAICATTCHTDDITAQCTKCHKIN